MVIKRGLIRIDDDYYNTRLTRVLGTYHLPVSVGNVLQLRHGHWTLDIGHHTVYLVFIIM